ncbi:hypothetical protein SteCoe_13516 [Stentor coeruleus]|uniref:Uncharacterized protein n=1 Tax=Stentor coeruleus TaxID=5963 RepID=A0A1R2C868_9CILI|nr:hypothetical protein SteCoe_13516 [Stentor coeruleus]
MGKPPEIRRFSEYRFDNKKNPSFKRKIKDKQIENQILLEKIKTLKMEIESRVFEEGNSMMQLTARNQEKIDYFKQKLESLQKKRQGLEIHQQYISTCQKLMVDNSRLVSEIGILKEKICNKKENQITEKDALEISYKLKSLEEEQNKTIESNFELKKELSLKRKENYERDDKFMSFASREMLIHIYADIQKILMVARRVSKRDQIKINELIMMPYETVSYDPVQMIGLVRKSTQELREVISDLYAEKCCDGCNYF